MYCTTLHCTTQHTFDTISNIISLIELHLSLHHNAMYCPLLVSITGTLPCQVPCNGPCNTGPISRPCGPVQARLSPTHLPPQARVCWSSRCPGCKTKMCHSTNPSLLPQGHKRGGHSVPALEQSDTLGRRRALGQGLHVSGVRCQVSGVTFFSSFSFLTKWCSLSGEGLLSTGPTPSFFL